MTIRYFRTAKMTCTAKIDRQTKADQKSEKSVWDGLKRLAETIADYAVEVYRYNNSPEPVFSNGGTRVIIRPGRIDLV